MLKNRITCVILCLFFIFSAVGCGSNTDDAYIYFELPEIPTTLDPQTASTDSELIIVNNIFEGLMRKDEKGEVTTGACESYTKEGLTYTFTLRKNMYWSNGEKVTADDFAFGIYRALNPETKSPFASRLFSIENAKEVNSGKLSYEKLGLTVKNSDCLEIRLEFDDSGFLNNLATSVAMPCNENFFKACSGKYGLFSDKIICNSSYRLTKWGKETFGIRLYKYEKYNGIHQAKNAAVFLTCNNDSSVADKLKENKIDIGFIDCALKDNMELLGFKTTNIENICWLLTFDNTLTKEMREAFLMLVGNDVYSESLPSGYTIAHSIYPNILSANCDGIGITDYSLEDGKKLFNKEIKKLEDWQFPSNIILNYYDNSFVKPAITDIVGHWQNNFSAFINIEAKDNKSYLLSQLKYQDLSLAVFPVRADSDNISEYLSKYGIDSSNPEDAQTKILASKNIFPLFFQSTTICYSSSIKEIPITNSNGFIDFSFIIKIEN